MVDAESHRQDGADRARVHRPRLGAPVARLRGPEELRPRPGDRRLDPLARRRRAGDPRAARRDPRDPRERRPRATATRSRGATSSGARWVRHGGLYPDWQLRLFRRRAGRFVRARRARVGDAWTGRVEPLREPLLHHSLPRRRRTSSRAPTATRRWPPRSGCRAGPARPARATSSSGRSAASSPCTLFARGFLDGWRGFVLAVLYAYYVFMRSAKVWETGERGSTKVTSVMTGRRSACCRGCGRPGRLHLGNYLGALANWVQAPGRATSASTSWPTGTCSPTDPEHRATCRANTHRDGGGLARRRPRSRALDAVHPVAGARARRAAPALLDGDAGGLARAGADLQGDASSSRGSPSPSYGLLGYPLLQSADILMYKAQWVPVGVDQVPHVELTREVARRFNNTFGAGVPGARGQADRDPQGAGHGRAQDVEVLRQRHRAVRHRRGRSRRRSSRW